METSFFFKTNTGLVFFLNKTLGHTVGPDQKLRNINEKPDGFIKLLTKKISYVGMSELVKYSYSFKLFFGLNYYCLLIYIL